MRGFSLKKSFNTSGLLYKSMELKDKLLTMSEYFARDGKRFLPLAIQEHYYVCDGYHVGVFVEKLQQYVSGFGSNKHVKM